MRDCRAALDCIERRRVERLGEGCPRAGEALCVRLLPRPGGGCGCAFSRPWPGAQSRPIVRRPVAALRGHDGAALDASKCSAHALTGYPGCRNCTAPQTSPAMPSPPPATLPQPLPVLSPPVAIDPRPLPAPDPAVMTAFNPTPPDTGKDEKDKNGKDKNGKDKNGKDKKDEKDKDKEEDKCKLLPEGWNFHAQTTIIPSFRPRIRCQVLRSQQPEPGSPSRGNDYRRPFSRRAVMAGCRVSRGFADVAGLRPE